MTNPTRLTPLSDPENVLFEEVEERPGLTEAEAYALLAGADTNTFGVPKITVAGLWGPKQEKQHPRSSDGKFRHKLPGISQRRLTDETSLRSDSQGRFSASLSLRPGDILGVTKDANQRIIMGPSWSGRLEKRAGDEWVTQQTTKFYGELLDSPFRKESVTGSDEFFIPDRVDGRLPQAEQRSTPSQISGDTAARFASASAGRDALTQGRSISEFSSTPAYTSLVDYRSESYKDINRKLHAGGSGNAGIDATMRESPLRGDVIVWRGGRNGDKRFGSAWNPAEGSMVGVEYRDLAYSSTSVDPAVASAFVGTDNGFLLKILAPAGTRGVVLTPSTMTNGEDEILLDRGLSFRIVGDHIEHGVRTFDVEVIS